jgi:hypothetical protein
VATPAPLVRLFTTLDQFEAKVAVAKLGAEGIVCELRGGISSAYPFGPVHVYVELTRADEAREILTIGDGEDVDFDFDGTATAERMAHRRARTRWVAVLGLLVVVAFGFARLVLML